MRIFSIPAFLLFVNAIHPTSADAATHTLSQEGRAWFNESGTCIWCRNNTNGNYYTGVTGHPSEDLNSYFIFDLTAISDTIVSADFRFTNLSSVVVGVDFTLYDFVGDIAQLSVEHIETSIGQDIYNDLGSGVSYGTFAIAPVTDIEDVVSVSLNAAGINALNDAQGGLFVMGASINNPPAGGFFGSGSGGSDNITELILNPVAVPEPSTTALLLACGLLAPGRRRTVR